jgi:hypothetical protein
VADEVRAEEQERGADQDDDQDPALGGHPEGHAPVADEVQVDAEEHVHRIAAIEA